MFDPNDFQGGNRRSGGGIGLLPMILVVFCMFMFMSGYIEKGVNQIPPGYRKEAPTKQRQVPPPPLEP